VRQWCLKFGQNDAHQLRHRRPRYGDSGIWTRCFLRFVVRDTICGERWIKRGTCWICGSQSRRTKKAAKQFFRKLVKGLHYVPRVIMTDKLKRDASGETRDPAWRGASAAQRIEQSRGKLAPTFAPTREENAALHISQTRAPFPLSFRPHLWPFPTTKTPFVCWGIPNSFTGPIPAME
jgi:putative transposase